MSFINLPSSSALAEVREADLRAFIDSFLRALGAPGDEAAIVTDGLMTASLWWHPGQGQGIEKLIRYHRRVRNGGLVPGVTMEWVRDLPSVGLLDAKKGFGYVAADRAMRRAVEKARATGIAMVGVRDSNHFGMAGFHARTAARAGHDWMGDDERGRRDGSHGLGRGGARNESLGYRDPAPRASSPSFSTWRSRPAARA